MAGCWERFLIDMFRWSAAVVGLLAAVLPAGAECHHWLPGRSGHWSHPLLSGENFQVDFSGLSDWEGGRDSAPENAGHPALPLAPRPWGQCPAGIRCGGHDTDAPLPKVVTPERPDAWVCLAALTLESKPQLLPFDLGSLYCLLLSRRLERPPRLG
jgi:hypothetical protein